MYDKAVMFGVWSVVADVFFVSRMFRSENVPFRKQSVSRMRSPQSSLSSSLTRTMSIFQNTEKLPIRAFHKQHVDETFYVIDNVICKRVTSLIVSPPFPRLHAARGILKSTSRKEEYVNCKHVADVYRVWDELRDKGTLIHHEVELVLKANTWAYVEERKVAWQAKGIAFEMRQFTEWLHHVKNYYTLVATEVTLADLVAHYAGTVDIILKHTRSGEYVLYDLKTCRWQTMFKNQPEYKQQLDMYKALFEGLVKGTNGTVSTKVLQVNKYNDDMSLMEGDEPIEDQFGSYYTLFIS